MTAQSPRVYWRLVTAARVLLGVDYLVNGTNWWFKIITPYPSVSDFATRPPPPDIVGALIATGFMFHIVKATELVTGVALLTNRFVPLMLVVAFPVTLSVFLADVFLVARLRGFVMGGGALIMNTFLIFAYLSAYAPLLSSRRAPDGSPAGDDLRVPGPIRRSVLPVYGVLAVVIGLVMVSWIAVMVAQYVRHPLPFGAH
jgi:hypothetical protein